MNKPAAKSSGLKKQSSLAAAVTELERQLGEQQLAVIYHERIRAQRTRSFMLGGAPRGKAPEIAIQHTLLGIELKIGKRRLNCPDWATARYLAVFARLGVTEVAVPYDITQISRLADELESGWFRLLSLAERASQGQTSRWRTRLLAHLIANQRAAVMAEGAGPAIPSFIQNTKQRRK
jgi:hypothetical protein